MHCLIAVFIGSVFYDIGEDAQEARNNSGLLFMSLMFVMFSAFSATLITCKLSQSMRFMNYFDDKFFHFLVPIILPIVVREHFNRWYKLRSFYLANKLADLPIQITAVFVYILIVYLMTGQILEVERFILLLMCFIAVSLVAQVIGLIVGIVLCLEVNKGTWV